MKTALKIAFNCILVGSLLAICAPLLSQAQATAKDWKPKGCQVDHQGLAEELMKLQLAGYQLHERTPCLIQKEFSFSKAVTSGSEEDAPRAEILFKADDKYQLSQPEKNSDGFYGVKVKWQWKEKAKEKPAESEFVFRRYSSKKSQARMGCGVILTPIKKVIVRESCYAPLAATFKDED